MAVAAAAALTGCGSEGTGPDEPRDTGPPVLSAHLTDLSRVRYIVPPGSISGDEIKGHSHVQTDGAGPVPVYAPVDMVLVAGTWVELSDDFGFEFEIGERFRLRLGHITDPRGDIAALIPRDDPSSLFSRVGPVPVAAGELIGHTTGTRQTNGFDFGLYDMDVEVVTPNAATYRANREWTKLNSVCPYDYFDAGLRAGYFALFGTIAGVLVPGADCRRIDDVALGGTLAGEWYLTSHPPDGTYLPRFAVGADLAGTAVRIAGIGGVLDVVGAPDPRTVVDRACYEGDGRFVFLRLTAADGLEAVAGPGPCPADFPGTGARSYRR